MRMILLLGATFFTTMAVAQWRGPVTVQPAAPELGTDPLLLVETQVPTWCHGHRLQVSATAAQVLIRSLVTSPQSSENCGQALRQVREVVNPRQFVPAPMQFANPLTVRFEYVVDGTVFETQETDVRFRSEKPAPLVLASGSFTSWFREKSGLFIDHQGSAMSATLVDYDAIGNPLWWVGAGVVNGNVFQGEMVTFKGGQCTVERCEARVQDQSGSISVVILDKDTILVNFWDVMGAGNSGTLEYRRLKLTQ